MHWAVEEGEQRELDAFASECAEREVAIKQHREAAKLQLDRECAGKLAECDARLSALLRRFRPSQTILDLKAQQRSMAAARHSIAAPEQVPPPRPGVLSPSLTLNLCGARAELVLGGG